MQNFSSVCLVLEDASPREVCSGQTGAWKVIAEFLNAAPLSFAASPEEEIVVPSVHFFQAQFYFYQKLN